MLGFLTPDSSYRRRAQAPGRRQGHLSFRARAGGTARAPAVRAFAPGAGRRLRRAPQAVAPAGRPASPAPRRTFRRRSAIPAAGAPGPFFHRMPDSLTVARLMRFRAAYPADETR